MSFEKAAVEQFMAQADRSVVVKNVSKMYPIYNSPRDRLKQQFRPGKKYYDEFWALQNINFEIKKGESIGVLGHNGAGKSTLLQVLAGTLKPTTGNVLIRGRVGAIMTMGSGFKQDFTGRENVYVLSALMDVSKAETDRQIEKIQEFAEIGFFFDRPLRTYSSGMVARLAFAVYARLEPDILIVDEAINVGDAEFKQKCLKHVSRLIAERGMSLLLASHSPLIVEQFCHQAIVLKKGEIIYNGDVKTALTYYNKGRP